MRPTKVLIVDDSATIRQFIRARLAKDQRVEVVGEAADPFDAREKIKLLRPHVLTLDVEMPRMNGLQFLERLMRLRPMPVVMISTLTHRGSRAALEALSLGAVDCVGKPEHGDFDDVFEHLPDLLVASANARLTADGKRPGVEPPEEFRWNGRSVFIGSSTGGVDALETLLTGFPNNCPPTLITQHMPASFLTSFAARLDPRIAPKLKLAETGDPLSPGHVYLAPGGDYHLTVVGGDQPRCKLIAGEKRSGHRPSVDVMFESALPMAKSSIAVILTGMGRDGAEGMLALRSAGARCIAQDEASSVVYGMPRVAMENGGAEAAFPLQTISRQILKLATKRAASTTSGVLG